LFLASNLNLYKINAWLIFCLCIVYNCIKSHFVPSNKIPKNEFNAFWKLGQKLVNFEETYFITSNTSEKIQSLFIATFFRTLKFQNRAKILHHNHSRVKIDVSIRRAMKSFLWKRFWVGCSFTFQIKSSSKLKIKNWKMEK